MVLVVVKIFIRFARPVVLYHSFRFLIRGISQRFKLLNEVFKTITEKSFPLKLQFGEQLHSGIQVLDD